MTVFMNDGMRDRYSLDILNRINELSSSEFSTFSLYAGSPMTHAEYGALLNDNSAAGASKYDFMNNGDATHALLFKQVLGYNVNPGEPLYTSLTTPALRNGFRYRWSDFDRPIAPVTGIASWFIIQTGLTTADTYDASGFSIIGTVGNYGSGSDIEIDNVNITAGKEIIFQDTEFVMQKEF